MKIFLSWSGPRSRAVAETLNDWLPRIIQAIKPFYSPEIEKGAQWSNEVDAALEGTRFGIICLTPDNIQSPWIHYESGALSKTKDALIWTFLHNLMPADVPPPLGKFQHTVAEKEDVLRLLKTINIRLADVGGEPLQDRLLEDNFELFWPRLEERLRAAEWLSTPAPARTPEGMSERPRDDRAILDEILELVRSQERRLLSLEEKLSIEPISDTRTDQSAARDEVEGKFTITDFNSGVEWLNETMISVEDHIFKVRNLNEYSPELNALIIKATQQANTFLQVAYTRNWLGTKGYKRLSEIRRRLREVDFLNNSYGRSKAEQAEKSE